MRFLNAYLWLLAIVVFSGLILVFIYVPVSAPVVEYEIPRHTITVGYVGRGIHFWAAHLLMIAVLVYFVRTFFVKTNWSQPRWASVLALLTFLLWFTGMLLPWDQLGYWMQSWMQGLRVCIKSH